jgi:hypothetical protein
MSDAIYHHIDRHIYLAMICYSVLHHVDSQSSQHPGTYTMRREACCLMDYPYVTPISLTPSDVRDEKRADNANVVEISELEPSPFGRTGALYQTRRMLDRFSPDLSLHMFFFSRPRSSCPRPIYNTANTPQCHHDAGVDKEWALSDSCELAIEHGLRSI